MAPGYSPGHTFLVRGRAFLYLSAGGRGRNIREKLFASFNVQIGSRERVSMSLEFGANRYLQSLRAANSCTRVVMSRMARVGMLCFFGVAFLEFRYMPVHGAEADAADIRGNKSAALELAAMLASRAIFLEVRVSPDGAH